jgi:hypothetical protein
MGAFPFMFKYILILASDYLGNLFGFVLPFGVGLTSPKKEIKLVPTLLYYLGVL